MSPDVNIIEKLFRELCETVNYEPSATGVKIAMEMITEQKFDLYELVRFAQSDIVDAQDEYAYKNGKQRFLMACDRYNKERNKSRLSKALDSARDLTQKVEEIKDYILEQYEQVDYEDLKKKENLDEYYFNNIDIKVLRSIGPLKNVCKLARFRRLEDEIVKKFEYIIFNRKYVRQIENKANSKKSISNKDGKKLEIQCKTMD